jgi:hypothetical protein
MARYKVVFSRRWITGRWGYTDRVIDQLGGRPAEPSRMQNAWLVPFEGTSFALGEYLTAALRIQHSRDAEPGAVFEIEELDPATPEEHNPKPRARRLIPGPLARP